jgi:hypothetical protein
MKRAKAHTGYCPSPYECLGKHKEVTLIQVRKTGVYYCHPCWDKEHSEYKKQEQQNTGNTGKRPTRLHKLLKEERRLRNQQHKVLEAVYDVLVELLDMDLPTRKAFFRRVLGDVGTGKS